MKRKKDELIPLGQSKHVIYVHKRGKYHKEKVSISGIIFLALGIVSILYCAYMAFFVNAGSLFFISWGIAGVIAIALAIIMFNKKLVSRIPKAIKIIFWSIFGLAFASLLFVCINIFRFYNYTITPDADIIYVLGCQAYDNGPGPQLTIRLDKALQYLNSAPNAKVIVSGNQGPLETISEAQCMKDYLVKNGISEDRIIMEDKASNTSENLLFCYELTTDKEAKKYVITNDFHMYRTMVIARTKEIPNIYPLSSGSYYDTMPNNILREYAAVMKNLLNGNISLEYLLWR